MNTFKHNAQSVLKLFNKVTDESVNPRIVSSALKQKQTVHFWTLWRKSFSKQLHDIALQLSLLLKIHTSTRKHFTFLDEYNFHIVEAPSKHLMFFLKYTCCHCFSTYKTSFHEQSIMTVFSETLQHANGLHNDAHILCYMMCYKRKSRLLPG